MQISHTDDMIDSRDVIARIEELEVELEDAILTDDGWIIPRSDENDVQLDMNEEHDELEALKELAEAGEADVMDRHEGVALISENYFETYAEEYASDVGAISSEHQWPLNHIDWSAAAACLQQDFTRIEWRGIDFWAR